MIYIYIYVYIMCIYIYNVYIYIYNVYIYIYNVYTYTHTRTHRTCTSYLNRGSVAKIHGFLGERTAGRRRARAKDSQQGQERKA